jgi:TrmH family RNA methyltransferase
VVDAARLHRAKVRRERGETILEGAKLLADALEAGVKVKTVFATTGEDSPPGALLVDDQALRRLSGTENPKGPIAIIDILDETDAGDVDMLVAVGVSDPGNVGTLVRIAASYGWAFGFTEGTADPWSPKVLRSGGGGQFQTAVVRLDHLPEMSLVATVVDGGTQPSEVVADRVAVLIGGEANGLPKDVVDQSQFKVTIKTPGPTESLNAAVAAGIVVNELSKRSKNPDGQV